MKLIAIMLNAGPDTAGGERKVTLLISEQGTLSGAKIGWPETTQTEYHWGPYLRVTPEEWLLHQQMALGEI